jgi:hypothetical protein
MRHTIDEAASLVGRTRRSLYRAMTEGRLSYGLEADKRRYIDTAELLRVYGAFEPPSQDVTQEMSHGVTVPDDLGEIIAKAVARAVAEAVEPLRQEIEKLRLENAEQRLIEHKPGEVLKNEESQPAIQDGMPEKPQSFADLLAGLK